MREESDDPSPTPSHFASGWSYLVAGLNLAVSCILGVMFVLAGLGSSKERAVLRIIGWIWMPPAMMAWDPSNPRAGAASCMLAFVWSCAVGIAVGVLLPIWRRRKSTGEIR